MQQLRPGKLTNFPSMECSSNLEQNNQIWPSPSTGVLKIIGESQMKRVSISIIALLVFSVLTPATAAHADTMGAIYDGTSGDVACSAGGFFTIKNNVFLEIPQQSHNCKGDIVIPSGVTTIAILATEWTSNEITSVVIPDSVTEIGANAFPFPQFTRVRIPDGVNSIGNDAFAYGSLTTFDYCGSLLTS